jgi:flagellar secretion chaperone FliS
MERSTVFAAYRHGAASYRGVGVETALTEASPHQLICLLFDGAIEAIMGAKHALTNNDIAARGQAITKAIRIVNEGLKASLDQRGGEITNNLDSLYDYACQRLLFANMRSDVAALDEVHQILDQLRDGWRAIGPKN